MQKLILAAATGCDSLSLGRNFDQTSEGPLLSAESAPAAPMVRRTPAPSCVIARCRLSDALRDVGSQLAGGTDSEHS
eukprot:450701-Pleurochrysis_carterae.AAC.1